MRECGGCKLCCWEAYVPELKKPVHSHCQYECETGCSIHNTDKQPATCQSYQCTWRRGYGELSARPDKTGLLVDIFKLRDEAYPFIYAREHKPHALSHGIDFLKLLMIEFNLPVIVIDYGVKPPLDYGNRVVVADFMLDRTSRLRGKLLEDRDDSFSIYELIRQAA